MSTKYTKCVILNMFAIFKGSFIFIFILRLCKTRPEMALCQVNFSVFVAILIGQFVSSATVTQAVESNTDQIENQFFHLRNLNTSGIINGILTHKNWKKNHDCLTELLRIRNGLGKRQKWAMKCKHCGLTP